jgi:hypothetical protein
MTISGRWLVKSAVVGATWVRPLKALFLFGLLAVCVPSAKGQVEAYSGEPFGVGRVDVALPPEAAAALDVQGLAIREAGRRVHYPVFSSGPVLRILNQFLGDGQTQPHGSVTVLFLFTGNQPLDITVDTPEPRSVRITPRSAPNARIFDRLLMRWWREYHAQARQQMDAGDYPPIVQTYLTSMLARRLDLTPPLLSRTAEQPVSEPLQTIELLAGVERLRLATLRETSSGQLPRNATASLPLPPEIDWTPLAVPPADAGVDVEPIAMRVPEQWFYVRFGNFTNFLWLDRLQRDSGGDLARMITLRGFDPGLSERVQKQLVVKQDLLAKLLGPTVIADVALVGRDIFLREGAAVGILFQARSPLLGVSLNQYRAQVLQANADQGASQQTVTIGGREVSLLSTPDNRLRSFYLVDGPYHLVTTSRAMVEQFLQVADGAGTLGASAQFRHARSVMPISRNDTIFVYFSPAFFQSLLSPQYQVELRRRLRAVTDLELVQLARWAAYAEGKPNATLDELVTGGLLPAGFGDRPDGSHPVSIGDSLLDSLRGRRGSFIPVPDVELRGVTRDEAQRLADQARYFAANWPQMDPLMIGIQRYALDDRGRERILVDAHVSPFAEQKYGWVSSLLGPPTSLRITPAPGDIVTAQASLRGGLLLPAIPVHHLFLGIQDMEPLTDVQPGGFLKARKILRTTPGYLGAWPKTGFLDLLPLQLGGGQPDAAGFSPLPLGIWRRQWESFSVLAADPNLLADVTPHLAAEEVEDEAQIRIAVGDLSESKLQTWVNDLMFARARQVSLGNARLLHGLSQQLAVPREDALRVAEDLLDAKLICTLGGQYTLDDQSQAIGLWKSDAWTGTQETGRPAAYRAALLEWFRGLEASLVKYDDRVVLHAQIDMQRTSDAPVVQLPSFFKFFGADRGQPGNQPLPEPEVIQTPAAKQPAVREPE